MSQPKALCFLPSSSLIGSKSVEFTVLHTTGPTIDANGVGSDPAPSSQSLKYEVQYKVGNMAYTFGASRVAMRQGSGYTPYTKIIFTPFAGWRAEFINFALAGDRTIIKLNPPLEKGTDRRDFNHSPTGHSRTTGPNE